MQSPPPSGIVTFLFTDIQGSTRLWQDQPQAMSVSHERHDTILRAAIESNHGYVFQIVGDSFSAAFHTPMDGLRACLAAQRGLQAETWGATGAIKVRMGLHTGTAEIGADGTYQGYTTLAATHRVMSAAHGGQTILTHTTCELLQNALPEGVILRDLGEHRLKDLHAPLRLYQVSAQDLPQEFPALRSLTQANNLPVQITSFVGREQEIVEIRTSLQAARLVTLTGSGGTGKTRLSIEVGAQELANFAHGVWFIELAPLSDPAQLIPTLAQAFGLQELPFNPLVNVVTDYLREKKLLLILDNCEHLITACARLANDLLQQCAGLKILASSREALGIAGEAAYRTPSLAVAEATRLFVERAHAANSQFSLTASNAASLDQICSRLDGIPLAIELAAARTKLFSPEQIAARLDDLFRLLIGGSRTALPRQQTLRALIDWSYDLLSEGEQQLLQTASVFRGGWTLEALEAISEDPQALEPLEGLVNKSLVVSEEHGSEMRFFLLETIRQYAREKLFAARRSSAVRDRHFVYFDLLSEKLWEAYRSPNAQGLQDKSKAELENLRAALEWGLEQQVETALHLAANYCLLLNFSANSTEALALLKSALAHVRTLPAAAGEADLARQQRMAMALYAQGMVGMGSAAVGFPEVLQSFQDAIALARRVGATRILGYSLVMYYTAAQFFNLPDGPSAAEEGFALLSEIGDWWGTYMATLNMVRVAASRGDLDQKQKYLASAEKMMQAAPLSAQTTGMFYLSMGFDERKHGNYELAKRHYENGLAILKKLRARNFEYVMLSELGHLARAQRDFAQAKEIYKQTIVNWQELGMRPAIAHQLECFAMIAIAEEQPQPAAKLLGVAETVRDKAQSPMTEQERVEYDQAITQLRAMLTEPEFPTLWAEGQFMTLEQAIRLALSL